MENEDMADDQQAPMRQQFKPCGARVTCWFLVSEDSIQICQSKICRVDALNGVVINEPKMSIIVPADEPLTVRGLKPKERRPRLKAISGNAVKIELYSHGHEAALFLCID